MRKIARLILIAALFRTGGNIRSAMFKKILGWDIHPSAKVGFSVVHSEYVFLGKGVTIGHCNVIRDINYFKMEEASSIGQWNWITASSLLVSDIEVATGSLSIGQHSAISSRHYIDCSGGVSIGEFSTIAGVRSTLITHQIDVVDSRQSVLPIAIGDYCLISSDVKIAPGGHVPNRSLIGMGSVVTRGLTSPETMYAGVPARAVKLLSSQGYFVRSTGWVGTEHIRERPQ